MSVAVTTGASFSIGERKTVVTGDFLINASHPKIDVSPGGSEFLMIRRTGEEVQTIRSAELGAGADREDSDNSGESWRQA